MASPPFQLLSIFAHYCCLNFDLCSCEIWTSFLSLGLGEMGLGKFTIVINKLVFLVKALLLYS